MLGRHRHASETPFKWCFAGGPTMARFYCHLDPPFRHKLKIVVGLNTAYKVRRN